MTIHRDYRVDLIVTQRVSFVVEATSPEEAELNAEDLLRDAEEPLESETLEVVFDDVAPLGASEEQP